MARASRFLALFVSIVVVGSLLPGSSAPMELAASSGSTKYGLHQDLGYDGDPERRAKAVGIARSVGAQISRGGLPWDEIEPVQGRRDWSRIDAVVDELSRAGIEPLFVILGSPRWANGAPRGTHPRYHVPTSGPEFDRWLAHYEDFVTAAVRRYSSKVKKWELWNEPNLYFSWKPVPNVDQYARFYRTIHRAIRSVDPNAQISSGGLASVYATSRGNGNITGMDFLKALHQRGIDPEIVNIHPYSSKQQAPDVHLRWHNNFDDIERVHDWLVSIGRGHVPIWATEWGWRSDSIGRDRQARYTRTALEMIRDRYPYVKLSATFVDYDRPGNSQGLYDAGFRPKPAADAFADFMRGR